MHHVATPSEPTNRTLSPPRGKGHHSHHSLQGQHVHRDCVSKTAATVGNITLLRNYIANIAHQTLPTVVLGDFNECLSETTANPSLLLGLMTSLGLHQLVDSPTTDSGSQLDHIFYNSPHIAALVDVVDVYYSDHDAMYVSLPL